MKRKFRAMWLLAALLGLAGLAPAQAKTGPSPVADHPKVAAARAAFQAADAELNRVYKEVRAKLSPELQQELKADEIAWIRGKEYYCGFQKEMAQESDPVAAEAEYYNCQKDFSVERLKYLRAWTGEGVPEGLPGEYDDGVGGQLVIRKASADDFTFALGCVRGPTAHTGSIEGKAVRLNDSAATFKEQGDCQTEEGRECCVLEFTIRGRRIEIKAQGCSYHHGARAFFDGKYLKISGRTDVKIME